MDNKQILDAIKGGLIVSCQALEDEPLHSSYIMGRMAYAATLGGAVGIRANSISDIKEIKQTTSLPIIGIIKQDYPDSQVRITPTELQVSALVELGVAIIATDATIRPRPNGISLEDFFTPLRNKYKNQLFMADCATYEDCVIAEQLGFDIVSTTLRGYTDDTKGISVPDFPLIKKLAEMLSVPVIAEGGIWSPEQLREALENGAFSAVVGTAITRPMEITKRYVNAIK